MTQPTKSKVPKIRFKGFAGVWVEKMLGDEPGEIIAGGDVDKSKLRQHGSYPVLANALQNHGILGYYEREFRVKAPAVTVTGRGDVGHAVAREVNFTPVVRLLSVKGQHNVYFLKESINNHPVLVESTGVPQLTIPQLSGYRIFFPHTTREESQIGVYFREVDRLIGLQQGKHEKLVTLKKAMLHAMFPKPGETTPEIRFKGFSGDWVKTKVDEICGETYGGGTPKTSERIFWEGVIPWIQSSDITDGDLYKVQPRKYISDLALRKSPTKLVPGNSIAIVTRVGVGKLALIEFSYATSQDFLSLSNLKLDQAFAVVALSILLQSKLHETQGTSIKGITKEELLAYSLSIPLTIAEQQKIGRYFRTLDELISQHALQLRKLKQLKAAFLEKMFV